MQPRAVLVLAVLVAAMVTSSHANWYGKRGGKDDLVGAFLRMRLDELQSSPLDAEAALQAIVEIVRLWDLQKSRLSPNNIKPSI